MNEQRDPAKHLRELRRALMAVFRTLTAFLLPDYLRGLPDATVEDRLPWLEHQGDGKMLGLVEALCAALATRRTYRGST